MVAGNGNRRVWAYDFVAHDPAEDGVKEKTLTPNVIDGPSELVTVLAEIAAERHQQDARWGEQNHPDGTGSWYASDAAQARKECEEAAGTGDLSWRHILLEEVAEAMAEERPDDLRRELIQVAAVAAAWAEAIDRRSAEHS
jgi:hypothetical protein